MNCEKCGKHSILLTENEDFQLVCVRCLEEEGK